MHRVNQKRKQAAILRIMAYAAILILSTVTTALLLYVALGYRLDSQSGHVVRSGLLLIKSEPEAATIYVNNEPKGNETPGRLVLLAGMYDLALKADGYRDWSKKVTIAASGVREVSYPLLIPNTLTPRLLISSVGSPTVTSQSQDRKHLLMYTSGQQAITLVELDPQEPNQTELPLGTAFTRENGQIGSLKVIEWALNNKQVLLEHSLPSGRIEFISYDITQPQDAVNITSLHSNQQFTNIHYVGGETKRVYGLSGTTLRIYQLDSTESEVVMQDIMRYEPYSDDTILFTRSAANGKNQIGIKQNKTTVILQDNVNPQVVADLAYARYDDHYYFVIAYTNGKEVTIYRDPLKKPILAKQLPFLSLMFENPQKLKFSDSAQFFNVQNGNTMLTYDFEDKLQYRVSLPFNLAEGSALTWLNSSHLQSMAADGMVHIFEYDGQNQQSLTTTKAGTRLYFAPNYQHIYNLTDKNSATQLDVTSLVNGKQ